MSQDKRSCDEETARITEELRCIDREIRMLREKLYKLENPSDYGTHFQLHRQLDQLINRYTRLAEKLRRGR